MIHNTKELIKQRPLVTIDDLKRWVKRYLNTDQETLLTLTDYDCQEFRQRVDAQFLGKSKATLRQMLGEYPQSDNKFFQLYESFKNPLSFGTPK